MLYCCLVPHCFCHSVVNIVLPVLTHCCTAGEAEFEALDKLDRLEVFEEYVR